MRNIFAQEPPVDAVVYKGISYVTADKPIITAKVWYGKSKKPKYYSFKSVEKRDAWIEGQRVLQDQIEQEKAQRKAAKKEQVAEMVNKINVGTLLHYSWGYDQTNAEFFQVVEKKGQYVWIREIGQRAVPGSGGFMSNRVMPDRDNFLNDNPPVKKLITAYGLSMDFGSASPIADDKAVYQSWYA